MLEEMRWRSWSGFDLFDQAPPAVRHVFDDPDTAKAPTHFLHPATKHLDGLSMVGHSAPMSHLFFHTIQPWPSLSGHWAPRLSQANLLLRHLHHQYPGWPLSFTMRLDDHPPQIAPRQPHHFPQLWWFEAYAQPDHLPGPSHRYILCPDFDCTALSIPDADSPFLKTLLVPLFSGLAPPFSLLSNLLHLILDSRHLLVGIPYSWLVWNHRSRYGLSNLVS